MQKIKWDFWFSTILICLIGIGVSFIFSASSIFALDAFGDMNYFLVKQIINVTLGLIAAIIVAKIPYQKIRGFIPMINLATIILMMLPLFPAFAVSVNGAERWVNLFGFSFQPSEVAKITIIFTVAHMIEVRNRLGILNNFSRGFVPIVSYLGLYILILVSIQKHLSAAMLVTLVVAAMWLIGGLSKKYFLTLGGLGTMLLVIGIIIEPFRLKRITGFLNPEDDPLGKGFQVLQGWYALGSGEFMGMGLGMSRQKFTWLPENHTDFILAIIGEETGFFGISAVIILFGLFVLRGLWIAYHAPDKFGLLIAAGITCWIFFQAFINMSVVSGLFPVTGMPLPFISYGGSSTIIMLMGVGFIFNVVSQSKIKD